MHLKIMKVCLEGFKRTGDDMYWEQAKIFGEWSKKFQKQIDELR